MEDERIAALMKYVRGEISFEQWIEIGGGGSGEAETEDIGLQDVEEVGREEESQGRAVESENKGETTDMITVLVSEPMFAKLAEIGSTEAPTTDLPGEPHHVPDSDPNECNMESQTASQPSVRMTDLLLQGAAAKSAKKHGGTGVDEFMEEIPVQKRRRAGRRKLYELPPKLKKTMGQANILWARGEIEKAKGICMELIRQVPKCSEPFQTLGMMYEEQGDQEKALQFFLIAAYLSKSGDLEEWVKLAMMSLEQNNLDQALTCYNQALKLEPTNLNVLWDRAALCYQMGDHKKALEFYESALKNVPSDDGAKFVELSCEMAKLYHENKSLDEAIKVLQTALSKHPDHANNQAINMLADLHMTSKDYKLAFEMISKYCDVKQEVMSLDTGESPLTSFSQLMNDEAQEGDISRSPEKDSGHKKINYIIPEDLPIDLCVKFAICLIHLRQLHAIKEILVPLFMETVESAGDLYIDVAEAYAENGDCEEALPILDMLVASKNFSLAAVWLKKGECLTSLGRIEEAASAYSRVVNLAPNHLDARLVLASLHQQLGRPNQALDVLSADPRGEGIGDSVEDEVAMDTSSVNSEGTETEPAVQPQDFRLLFHKCALLHSQSRMNEFLDAGIKMFRLFFIDVYYIKDLTDMALKSSRFRRELMQKEALEQEESRSRASVVACSRGDTGLRIEEWWEMFKKVVSSLSGLKRHSEAQHMVLCALASDRFSDSYQTELVFMSIVALYLNREYKVAFDATKILIARDKKNPVLWNILSRITARSGDCRHQRYVLRLLIKSPDEFPLVMFSGHNALVSGSYRFAVGEYVRAFRQAPEDPLISLCLGLQYIHLACQRFPRNRHFCVVQGIIFLFQYLGLRGECQEAFYNIARAFHQLGLLQFAVHYYNKALEFPLHEASKSDGSNCGKFSEKHDLHRETAFNLSLIYRASGNEIMARELLMTHCWV